MVENTDDLDGLGHCVVQLESRPAHDENFTVYINLRRHPLRRLDTIVAAFYINASPQRLVFIGRTPRQYGSGKLILLTRFMGGKVHIPPESTQDIFRRDLQYQSNRGKRSEWRLLPSSFTARTGYQGGREHVPPLEYLLSGPSRQFTREAMVSPDRVHQAKALSRKIRPFTQLGLCRWIRRVPRAR
ncbi:Uncharacterised protein [Pseudomonas putida]|nr:Uncharacterised protein [Pseudomonas putida]CAB5580649.1 Uncharacterised protein [Pseudomonas putida]CAB5623709.1 Uncharacterised protein [Pseudomonas putida]CAB5623889.1 Uncharacterised protein [Pseudomonas putida]CAB5702913.1 Uncharacterised protein [Pseudomonas putida]